MQSQYAINLVLLVERRESARTGLTVDIVKSFVSLQIMVYTLSNLQHHACFVDYLVRLLAGKSQILRFGCFREQEVAVPATTAAPVCMA